MPEAAATAAPRKAGAHREATLYRALNGEGAGPASMGWALRALPCDDDAGSDAGS